MANTNTVDFLQGAGSKVSGETNLPAVARGTYNRSLLERSYPHLMHQQFGKQYPLAQRSGQSMVFRRYERRALATVPLSDGVTPPGTTLYKTDYRADIKQYGNFTVVTDWVDFTHVDPIISEAVELMGENMGESMDAVYREPLVAGSSVFRVAADATVGAAGWTSGAGRVNVAGTICKGVLDAAIRVLKGVNAKAFTPMIAGSSRVGTFPVGKAFWCLIHSDQEHDLYNLAHSGMAVGDTFTPVERYSNHTGVMENEVGKYRNVRFVTSTSTKIWAQAGAATSGAAAGMKTQGTPGTSQADVYACLLFAQNAYGVVPLARGSARTIVHRAGSNTDPLNQRNTVGWKAAGVSVILNDEWMTRLEVTSLQ